MIKKSGYQETWEHWSQKFILFKGISHQGGSYQADEYEQPILKHGYQRKI
ncbi:MAG: hypothetical protein JEZ06_16610 [Anaerolineaceae bacterium]|nr:hypothetical protein [Anaerolineaceae bacterium]